MTHAEQQIADTKTEAELDALIEEWILTCPCECCERYRKAFAARAGFFAAKIEEQLKRGSLVRD